MYFKHGCTRLNTDKTQGKRVVWPRFAPPQMVTLPTIDMRTTPTEYVSISAHPWFPIRLRAEPPTNEREGVKQGLARDRAFG